MLGFLFVINEIQLEQRVLDVGQQFWYFAFVMRIEFFKERTL